MKTILLITAALAFWISSCTPAQRAKIVPVLSQVDAIGQTVAQAAGWCADHGGDVTQVAKAIEQKDPGAAIAAAHNVIDSLAKSGVDIPPEVVGLVQTAEGALAAHAIQEGMTRLSTGGAPATAPPSTAPLPSSGL